MLSAREIIEAARLTRQLEGYDPQHNYIPYAKNPRESTQNGKYFRLQKSESGEFELVPSN